MKNKLFLTFPFFILIVASILICGLWGVYAYISPYSTFSVADEIDIPSLGLFAAIPLFALLNINYFKTELADKPLLRRMLWLLTIALAVCLPARNFLNVLFDHSAPQEIVVRVDQKSVLHGRSTHYKLAMKNTFLGPELQILEVEQSLYESVQVGDRIALQIHSGAFGLPWFSGVWKTAPAQ